MFSVKRLRNPFVQQYIVEILFPLLGYFFFDWGVLIIAVYYLIDHFCAQVLFFRRAYWVNTRAAVVAGKHHFVLSIFVFATFFFLEIGLVTYCLMEAKEMTSTDVLEAFIIFAKNELWFLFPVVLVFYHLKDQFAFYMPRHYLHYTFIPFLWLDAVKNGFILVLIALFGSGWFYFKINDLGIIFIFLAVKIAFDLTLKKILIRQSLID